jgi:hypothetical protein
MDKVVHGVFLQKLSEKSLWLINPDTINISMYMAIRQLLAIARSYQEETHLKHTRMHARLTHSMIETTCIFLVREFLRKIISPLLV